MATPKNVFYGCNECGQERAVETEADIPAGHLCSKECREAAAAKASAEQGDD